MNDNDRYRLRGMAYDLWNCGEDVFEERLLSFMELSRKVISKPVATMRIKIRNGLDYVYATYTDPRGNAITRYIGKFASQGDINASIETLTHNKPKEADYILSGKKLARAQAVRVYLSDVDVEGLGGILITHKYDRERYLNDWSKYVDTVDKLSSDAASLANTTNIKGITRIQNLIDSGYEIKPL
jgi:hypothetical protein